MVNLLENDNTVMIKCVRYNQGIKLTQSTSSKKMKLKSVFNSVWTKSLGCAACFTNLIRSESTGVYLLQCCVSGQFLCAVNASPYITFLGTGVA